MCCSKISLSAWTQVLSFVRHWWMIHHAVLELMPCLNQLLSQVDFCISLGSAVTFLRWSGQTCSQLVSCFLRSLCTKNHRNRFIFDRVIPKIKRGTFFWDSVDYFPWMCLFFILLNFEDVTRLNDVMWLSVLYIGLYSPLWALIGFVIVVFLIYWLISAFELW